MDDTLIKTEKAQLAMDILQTVELQYEFPVVFGRNLLVEGDETLAACLRHESTPPKVMVFVDSGTDSASPDCREKCAAYLRTHGFNLVCEPLVFPGGEAGKAGWEPMKNALDEIIRYKLCRHSVVIAIGGGAMLDAVGLAASLVHRGVRLLRMPSTALAQGDSGVGVKTGINFDGQKNLIGTFAPPYGVVNDLDFLSHLPQGMLLDGVAEAIKVATIKDAEFFARLEADAARISSFDLLAIEPAIVHSAQLHLEHIRTNGDPFEMGSARPLDFGHWAAHRLELDSSHSLRHGEAVAIGMALDIVYSARVGLIKADERQRMLSVISGCGLPLWSDLLERREQERPCIFAGIEDFREHLGGKLALTLPIAIGSKTEIDTVDDNIMQQSITELKEYAHTITA